ncbi:mycothiol-dependent nitroreductase Rv2466c family protein [Plantactinospora sp. CA-290183]|uniref:mycothiol-dependent nitroreductase Rv2466c family protein n=1 Tax=Plantactinospora sp. CA-290183 TaxID=3240006 RepID=UPI003D8E22D7
MAGADEVGAVDFWFDPSCPYTWITARWLREVERVRPVRVRWHVMSLSVLNEGRDDDPEGDPEGYLWGPVRLFAVVAQRYGQDALARLYATYGTSVHGTGGGWPDVAAILVEAGLPGRLVEVMESTGYDGLVRESHEAGISLVGPHVGTPIVAAELPGGRRIACFGPVISRVPHGEEAGRLWDGTLLVAGVPGFHELKGRPHEPPVPG